jgi:hypothetical protein
MKKIFFAALMLIGSLQFIPNAQAGDCTVRDTVNWHATITTAVNVRADCPTGDVVGVVPGGEVVEILEVDRYQEFYLIKTSVGTGFVFSSFLKDITKSPLVSGNVDVSVETRLFVDLDPNHRYYDEIADVKARGIVQGSSGKIYADQKINRAELAKILVEATTDSEVIANASLDTGVYSDVEKNAWYLPYLDLAKKKGIMTGDSMTGSGATTVRPGDYANGAEVAKMIAVGFDLDVRVAASGEAWYQPYFEALQQKGALPYIKADHMVTRAEMMFMVSVVLKNKVN